MKITPQDVARLVLNMVDLSADGLYIKDDLGYHWVWDGRRLRCIEGEIDIIEKGENPRDNGYWADTFEEVKDEMVNGGYIANWDSAPVYHLSQDLVGFE